MSLTSLQLGYIKCRNDQQGDQRRWFKLFNSLIIVMNQDKQIVSWHFTKSEKFDFIKDLMVRLKEHNFEDINMVILDNCCKWENKLTELFGDVNIKLDPFHAIQRITKTIRKKHPFHNHICADLLIAFTE